MYLEENGYSDVSLLCIISNRDKRNKILDVLKKQKTLLSLTTLAKGTANSKILSYLGLGETERIVFFIILPTNTAYQVMKALDKTLLMSKPGHGISFLTEVHAGCFNKLIEFESKGNGALTMEKKPAHNLIITVFNRGYSEEVMDAAREAGATGGTLLHAHSCGIDGMEKFFGAVIAPEKEMLMILAEEKDTANIMTSVAGKTGPTFDAGAVSFSLPINSVNGLPFEKSKKESE